jgi:membrane protease YdiL (CAAX protease family)
MTGVLVGLTALSRTLLPSFVVGDVGDLDPASLEPPAPLEQALTSLRSADNLFWLFASLLALVLIPLLFSFSEAGLTRPGRRLHLLLFPLLVATLYLSAGFYLPAPALFTATLVGLYLSTFGEELVYRGLMWRALVPTGVVRTVVLTALLAGILHFVRGITSGPWPEAAFVTLLAVGGGFAYGALRWRTASIWPAVGVHLAIAVARDVSAPGERTYQLLLLLTTVGFVIYGLVLLRNRRARTDGA